MTEGVDRDRTAKRVLLTIVAVPVGWVFGVYIYVGLLYLFDDDAGAAGGIHVGALALGFIGMLGLPLATWRWTGRLSEKRR